jgi:hypothetical protein
LSTSARLFSLIVLSLVLCEPGSAWAADVCIAKPNAQVDLPRAIITEGSRVLGTLEYRRCYPVMERLDKHTRIFVAGEFGFHGEVEVSNAALAQVLTDDIDMVLEPGGEVFGKALSGALVFVGPHPSEEFLRATLVEGRIRAQFLVEIDDVYPAQSWPAPDPDESAGSNWPEAGEALPPSADGLLDEPQGMGLRAEILAPLSDVSDLLNDPGLGEWRMSVLEQGERARKVRIVGPTAWAEGWVQGGTWMKETPTAGWDALQGFSSGGGASGGVRQVAKKVAPLHLAVKGPVLGSLQPGARVDLIATEKSWLKVRSRWEGGEVSGWIEKKKLVKEGKEGPLKARVEKVSAIWLARSALQWMSPEDHREEVPLDESESAAPEPAGEAVQEGEATEPVVQTRIPEPEMDIDPVLRRLRQSMPRLQWLYAKALAKTPGLDGEITVRMVVDAAGTVEEKGIFSSSVDDKEIAARITADLEEVSFEKRRIPRRKRGQAKKDWRLIVWVQYALSPVMRP